MSEAEAATGRILSDLYGEHYAKMLRGSPDYYLGVLSVGDLREMYVRGCLTLGEFERFADEALRRATQR